MIQFAENRCGIKQGMSFKGFSHPDTALVRKLQQMVPSYAPTSLVSLKYFAERTGVRAVLLKDESSRFGLNAFKGLGGIYAMFRVICRELELDPEKTTVKMLQEPPLKDRIRQMVFATTTDGNHGKGVSWAARVFGCKAFVFMPAGTVEVRARAIRDAGNAEVSITGMHYDECVAWTARQAEQNGWHLIQDTSWSGYEEIPGWIMQGYTTMYYEALQQIREMGYDAPTHMFLQAGVGSMAGAIAAAALSLPKPPVIATVESSEAACFYDSFRVSDGSPKAAHGSEKTIMAGLNCSVPCSLAWEILKKSAAGGFACKDLVTCEGMRLLADNPQKIVSGESGAVTAGLLKVLFTEPKYENICRNLKFDRNSVVLLFSTEGDTDPENYQRIIA